MRLPKSAYNTTKTSLASTDIFFIAVAAAKSGALGPAVNPDAIYAVRWRQRSAARHVRCFEMRCARVLDSIPACAALTSPLVCHPGPPLC